MRSRETVGDRCVAEVRPKKKRLIIRCAIRCARLKGLSWRPRCCSSQPVLEIRSETRRQMLTRYGVAWGALGSCQMPTPAIPEAVAATQVHHLLISLPCATSLRCILRWPDEVDFTAVRIIGNQPRSFDTAPHQIDAQICSSRSRQDSHIRDAGSQSLVPAFGLVLGHHPEIQRTWFTKQGRFASVPGLLFAGLTDLGTVAPAAEPPKTPTKYPQISTRPHTQHSRYW